MKRESSQMSKFLIRYFITTSLLCLITVGVFKIPFVSSTEPPEEPKQKDEWDIELEDAETDFDEFFILYDLDSLEAALRVDLNFSKEQKEAFGWSNSSEVYVLSALGQVRLLH